MFFSKFRLHLFFIVLNIFNSSTFIVNYTLWIDGIPEEPLSSEEIENATWHVIPDDSIVTEPIKNTMPKLNKKLEPLGEISWYDASPNVSSSSNELFSPVKVISSQNIISDSTSWTKQKSKSNFKSQNDNFRKENLNTNPRNSRTNYNLPAEKLGTDNIPWIDSSQINDNFFEVDDYTLKSCTMDEFKCDTSCIPVDWVCDGKTDCRDHADEKNCK